MVTSNSPLTKLHWSHGDDVVWILHDFRFRGSIWGSTEHTSRLLTKQRRVEIASVYAMRQSVVWSGSVLKQDNCTLLQTLVARVVMKSVKLKMTFTAAAATAQATWEAVSSFYTTCHLAGGVENTTQMMPEIRGYRIGYKVLPPHVMCQQLDTCHRHFWHATQNCIAPYVDIILHRGQFWAKSAASGT